MALKLTNLMTKDRKGNPLSRDEAFEDNQVGWYVPKYDVSVVVTLLVERNRIGIEMNFDKPIPEVAQKEIETAVQNALQQEIFKGNL